jgi:predicted DCC family thiol-disulfide oxidoreductase YuxK
MITVFYDGKCNLCLREIDYYRSIAPINRFIWVDITTPSDLFKSLNISLIDGLSKLHALDDIGAIHTGVDAFTLMWKEFKYWNALAGIISLPGIYQLSKIAYFYFAKWRFKRLKHCQVIFKKNKQ